MPNKKSVKRIRPVLLVAMLLFAAASAYWLFQMSGMEISREASIEAGRRNLTELRGFWIGAASMWAPLTGIFIWLWRRREAHGNFRRDAIIILSVAAALRVALLVAHSPGLSDDIWRYLFDGQTLAHGHNPYLVAPGETSPEEPRFSQEPELARRVNNPELVTIYLPTSQIVFAGSALVSNLFSLDVDAGAVLLRGVIVVFDLGSIVFVLLLLRRMGKNAWWAVLYAWHPLPVTEFAGSGHQDSIGIMFMLMALYFWAHRPAQSARWTAPLAVAGCAKPVPIPLAVMMLRERPRREWVISAVTGAMICVVLFGAFLLSHDGLPAQRLMETVRQFVKRWAFHGSIYGPILHFTQDTDQARWICLSLLALVFLVIWWLKTEPIVAARAFMFAALLFSTTAHPWYLLWALVLVPLAPSPAVWIASLTLPWAYAVLGDVVDWTVPEWVPWLTYVPVYAALIADWVWRIRRANASV